jgi:Zn-finger nucleic acid-binding protein
MRCPVCKTPTDLIQYERIPVYNCGSCGGYWVTKAKLDLILMRREVQMPEAVQKKMIEIANASNSTAQLCCLTCGSVMKRGRFKRWPDIQIDVCPKCQHIWLDRGELEKCQIYWERAQDQLSRSRPAEARSPAAPAAPQPGPPAEERIPQRPAAPQRRSKAPPTRRSNPSPNQRPKPPSKPAPSQNRYEPHVKVREIEPDPDFLAGQPRSRWGQILGDLFGAG